MNASKLTEKILTIFLIISVPLIFYFGKEILNLIYTNSYVQVYLSLSFVNFLFINHNIKNKYINIFFNIIKVIFSFGFLFIFPILIILAFFRIIQHFFLVIIMPMMLSCILISLVKTITFIWTTYNLSVESNPINFLPFEPKELYLLFVLQTIILFFTRKKFEQISIANISDDSVKEFLRKRLTFNSIKGFYYFLFFIYLFIFSLNTLDDKSTFINPSYDKVVLQSFLTFIAIDRVFVFFDNNNLQPQYFIKDFIKFIFNPSKRKDI